MKKVAMFFAVFALLSPVIAEARVQITEVMYDPKGADSGHEWIEIYNPDSTDFDLTDATLFEEEVNHKLKTIIGTSTLPAGAYAVIADDAEKFKIDWPQYQNTLFDSVFSLKNTGELLILKQKDVQLDQVSFDSSIGAAGDGTSLQLNAGLWVAAAASPGTATTMQSQQSQQVSLVSASVSASGQVIESMSSIPPVPVADFSSVNNSTYPVDPQIFCRIKITSLTVFAGTQVFFSAESWGLKREPLQNARYIWNFGDTLTAEGQGTSHSYTQPGSYVVFLQISSNTYSASDRVTLHVIVPSLVLSISPDVVNIVNRGTSEVDLYGLKLSVGSDNPEQFFFPEKTFVSGKGTLSLSRTLLPVRFQERLDLIGDDSESFTLRFMNGTVIATSTDVVLEIKATPPTAAKNTKAVKAPAKPAVKVSAKAKPKTKVIDLPEVSEVATTSPQLQALVVSSKVPWWQYYGATGAVLVLLAASLVYVFKSKPPLDPA